VRNAVQLACGDRRQRQRRKLLRPFSWCGEVSDAVDGKSWDSVISGLKCCEIPEVENPVLSPAAGVGMGGGNVAAEMRWDRSQGKNWNRSLAKKKHHSAFLSFRAWQSSSKTRSRMPFCRERWFWARSCRAAMPPKLAADAVFRQTPLTSNFV